MYVLEYRDVEAEYYRIVATAKTVLALVKKAEGHDDLPRVCFKIDLNARCWIGTYPAPHNSFKWLIYEVEDITRENLAEDVAGELYVTSKARLYQQWHKCTTNPSIENQKLREANLASNLYTVCKALDHKDKLLVSALNESLKSRDEMRDLLHCISGDLYALYQENKELARDRAKPSSVFSRSLENPPRY